MPVTWGTEAVDLRSEDPLGAVERLRDARQSHGDDREHHMGRDRTKRREGQAVS